MTKLIFVVDHPTRDLPALAWISSRLTTSGIYECSLVSKSDISYLFLLRNKPDVLVWNYARPSNSALIKFAKVIGIKNVVHDTEGIPYKLDSFYTSLDRATLLAIDLVWTWGHSQSQHIDKLCTDLNIKQRSFPLGSIRYEYLKHVSQSREKPPLVERKILINTNFPLISPKYGNLEHEYNVTVLNERAMQHGEFLQALVAISSVRQSLISLVETLLDYFHIPVDSLILRPHPYESLDPYQSLLTRGILLSDVDGIEEDLHKSKLVINCGCQTTLDALIFGVPTVTPTLNNNNLWCSFSTIASHSELAAIISQIDFHDDKQSSQNHLDKILPLVNNFSSNITFSDFEYVKSISMRCKNLTLIHLLLSIIAQHLRLLIFILFSKPHIIITKIFSLLGIVSTPAKRSKLTADQMHSFCIAHNYLVKLDRNAGAMLTFLMSN